MIEMSVPVFVFIIVLIIALIFMSILAGMAIAYYDVYDDLKWEKRFNKLEKKKD